MATDSKPVSRDPAKPAAYFMKLATLEKAGLRSVAGLKGRNILTSRARRHLRLAMALYSAGEPIKVCHDHLDRAATALVESLLGSVSSPIQGVPNFDAYVEVFCAAWLEGRGAEIATAFRGARFEDIKPWQQATLESLCVAFEGGRLPARAAGPSDAEYGPLFWEALACIGARDRSGFGPTLDAYLAREYAPVAERAARYELNTANVMYAGRWTLFAAASLQLMGEMPTLSAHALRYCPVALVDAAPAAAGAQKVPAKTAVAANSRVRAPLATQGPATKAPSAARKNPASKRTVRGG